MLLPAPIPKRNPKACIMLISENTTPTAADALVFICDTKNVSAVLYMAVTSMLIIIGTAKDGISFSTGVFTIFSNCLSSAINFAS